MSLHKFHFVEFHKFCLFVNLLEIFYIYKCFFLLYIRFQKALKLPSQNNTSEDNKDIGKNGLKSAHKSNVCFIFIVLLIILKKNIHLNLLLFCINNAC